MLPLLLFLPQLTQEMALTAIAATAVAAEIEFLPYTEVSHRPATTVRLITIRSVFCLSALPEKILCLVTFSSSCP